MKRGGYIARRKRLRTKGRRRITAGNDEPYLAWVRTLRCAVATHTESTHDWRWPYPCDPHHLRSRNLTGQDRGNVIPLCRPCHDLWHSIGRQSFQRQMGLDAVSVAKQLAEQYEQEGNG